MSEVGSIFGIMEALSLSFIVAFLRLSGAMLALPALGERMVPIRVRLSITFAFGVILAPLLPLEQVPERLSMSMIVTEVTIGAIFGAALRFMSQALLVAGTIAAQATSLAQLFGAPSSEPSSAIGNVLHITGLALLMAGGFHLSIIEFAIESWRVAPVGLIFEDSSLSEWGVERVQDAFALALALSMPFVILSVLYNFTLGIINKAMPQLMVALVGAPAITGLSVLTLAISVTFILTAWRDHFYIALNERIWGI